MKIDWRPKAVRDLDAIVDYISADNPVAAVEQGDEIYEQVTDIKNFPERGRRGRVHLKTTVGNNLGKDMACI